MNITHQQTIAILKRFEEISRFPRRSTEEGPLVAHLREWADGLNLESILDKVGNLLIKIPASQGYENEPAVILQGHLDMVCEKEPDSDHDFSKDPIRFVYDDDYQWLKADKTSLGADNGIAIAMGMVVADDKTCKHPALELLFTIDEETGFTGAEGLESGFVDGKRLINLDSEDVGVFTVGCAGGMVCHHTIPLEWVPVPGDYKALRIEARGMTGGHSADIHHEKTNAIKVIARTLLAAGKDIDILMADIKGGTADNAIPRETQTIAFIPGGSYEKVEAVIRELEAVIKVESKATDPDLEINLTPVENTGITETMSLQCTQKIVHLLLAIPHGIWAMSRDLEHTVETSNNLANLKLLDKKLDIATCQRSPFVSRLEALLQHIEAVVHLTGGVNSRGGEFPGWHPNMDSVLLKKCVAVYRSLFNEEPVVEATHGGLECGVIGNTFKGMDMISFGPTICYPHSPDEKINIPSIGKTWDLLVAILADKDND